MGSFERKAVEMVAESRIMSYCAMGALVVVLAVSFVASVFS